MLRRDGSRFEGPSTTFGEMAFSERRSPCSPVPEVASAETGQGSSSAESTTSSSAEQSARGSRSVQRLETAISALREMSPHGKPLVEALRIARAKSAVPPLQQRIQSCKLHIERAKQLVVRAEAVITRAVEQKMEKLQRARRDFNNSCRQMRCRHRQHQHVLPKLRSCSVRSTI